MKIIGLISMVVLTAAVVVSAAPETPLAKGRALQILVDYMELLQEDTSPKELAVQLGADAYKERTLAQRRLLSMGQKAIPVLKEAATSHDPEIRISARKILSQICDESTKGKWRETIRGVNRALDSLAIAPDKEAWSLLLRLMSKVPPPQEHRVAAALGAFGTGTLHKVALALRQELMTKEDAVMVLAAVSKKERLSNLEHMDPVLKKLLPHVDARLAEEATWKHAWTTGRIDKHIYGLHAHTYTSPPLAHMAEPVLGIVYGLWGGKGQGDSTAAPSFTVFVNDLKVGHIPANYDGYGSPGPSLQLFDLSKCSPGSTCKVRIQASSGGDAIIGEVKIYDLTAKDPGVIKANRVD